MYLLSTSCCLIVVNQYMSLGSLSAKCSFKLLRGYLNLFCVLKNLGRRSEVEQGSERQRERERERERTKGQFTVALEVNNTRKRSLR